VLVQIGHIVKPENLPGGKINNVSGCILKNCTIIAVVPAPSVEK
jgi:hypothetical protein